MSEDPGERGGPVATLLATMDDPSAARRHLPSVLSFLDRDDRRERVRAAWAVCLVAATTEEVTGYLTRRLLDRLEEDDPALEVEVAFSYLSGLYPDAVEAEIEAMAEEERDDDDGNAVRRPPTVNDYALTTARPRSLGRTRPPSRDEWSDLDEDAAESEQTDAATGESTGGEATAGRGASTARTGDDEADVGEPGNDGGGLSRTGRERKIDNPLTIAYPDSAEGDDWASVRTLSAIARESTFGELTVYGREPNRYGAIYRSLGVASSRELPIGLQVFETPVEHGDQFLESLTSYLEEWATMGDHGNVVRVHDWSVEPVPWAALEFTSETLDDREAFGPNDALWNARRLGAGVQYLHEHGVVHGGIDPRNVGYHERVFDDEGEQSPLLTNVGLMHVYRLYFDPSQRLDPRYAAPEYFDRSFGRIDHVTDVYHLGAVCYRLFTGKHPYEGSYAAVRESVLEGGPPRPGKARELPAGVDDVVTKAMAKRKLHRYETATDMVRELGSIGGERS